MHCWQKVGALSTMKNCPRVPPAQQSSTIATTNGLPEHVSVPTKHWTAVTGGIISTGVVTKTLVEILQLRSMELKGKGRSHDNRCLQ